MKKTFQMIDLDCANCAAKMEAAIKKLDGVNDASVSFLSQKMTIDAEDDKFDEIVKQAVKVCKKVEPDCEVVVCWSILSRCLPRSPTRPSTPCARRS